MTLLQQVQQLVLGLEILRGSPKQQNQNVGCCFISPLDLADVTSKYNELDDILVTNLKHTFTYNTLLKYHFCVVTQCRL